MAISVHASAFIPWVLAKMSTLNPAMNESVSTQLVDNVIGRLIIKYMNTKGTATLNRQMLLNTIACAKTRMTNSNENCTIDFVFADIVFVSRFTHLRLSH